MIRVKYTLHLPTGFLPVKQEDGRYRQLFDHDDEALQAEDIGDLLRYVIVHVLRL
jgi:hypothetical protein